MRGDAYSIRRLLRRPLRNTVSRGATSVGPASILGTKLVLDLNSDRGITLGVGSRVQSWADESGLGNTASQAIMATQPTRVLNAFDGHAVINHVSGQYLERATFAGIGAGDRPRIYSIGCWSAAYPAMMGTLIELAYGAGVAPGEGALFCYYGSNMLVWQVNNAPLQNDSAIGGSSVPALFDGRIEAGIGLTVAINGVDAPIVDPADAGVTLAIDRLTIGVRTDKATQLLDGRTVRHIVANPAPTPTEHAALMAYLKLTYPSLGLP
jgi:hypothetical protein